MLSNAALISSAVSALKTWTWSPKPRAAVSTSRNVVPATAASAGLTRTATRAVPGTSSRSNSNRFADKSIARKVMPVRLPPGRARLATRPRLTGSSPTVKTMGIVVVAALAASADNVPPLVAITATWRRTNSLASAGNWFSSL
jgi:hypothetical protein